MEQNHINDKGKPPLRDLPYTGLLTLTPLKARNLPLREIKVTFYGFDFILSIRISYPSSNA